MIGAVILAAGSGRRMGGVAKALLPTRGTTFLGAIVRACAKAGVDPDSIVIVVGEPHGAAVAHEAARHALAGGVVWNDDPSRGMASSVAIGFEAVARSACHAALLWPVDHANITPATIEALGDALGDHDAAVPVFAAHGGHPALVARSIFAQMIACGDAIDGARGVLRAARVIRVPVLDDGVLRDADTPEDLA